jgi:hypothetical protein
MDLSSLFGPSVSIRRPYDESVFSICFASRIFVPGSRSFPSARNLGQTLASLPELCFPSFPSFTGLRMLPGILLQ